VSGLEFVNFYLIPGLVLGCIYAISAVGLSLLFGILRFANFAHGDMMSWGGYSALVAVTALGIGPWASIPVAIVSTVALGLLVQRLFYGRLRGANSVVLLISGFGVALMIRAILYFLFGPTEVTYGLGIQRPFVWEGFRIQWRHMYFIGTAVVIVTALHLFLTRTRTGKAMRAMSDNPDLARITGIPTDRVVTVAWMIGGSLTAVAGVFVAIDTQLSPLMGFNLLLPTFAAAILGGIGKPYGAIMGGLVIGLAEEMSSLPLIDGQPLLTPAYKTGVAFAILVAVLIVRPTGIFRSPQ
jgi:branched-subunit amino acid ABC-type transport system permease component